MRSAALWGHAFLTCIGILCLSTLKSEDKVPPGHVKNDQQVAGEMIKIDDSNATATYANFVRVTGTPEELLFDFALNPQPMGVPKDPLVIKQRIVVNFYTAKRMLTSLQMSIDRHEAAFGKIETDVEKRVKQ